MNRRLFLSSVLGLGASSIIKAEENDPFGIHNVQPINLSPETNRVLYMGRTGKKYGWYSKYPDCNNLQVVTCKYKCHVTTEESDYNFMYVIVHDGQNIVEDLVCSLDGYRQQMSLQSRYIRWSDGIDETTSPLVWENIENPWWTYVGSRNSLALKYQGVEC